MAVRKNFWFKFFIFLIAALGVFIRLNVFRHNFSLWHDECALAYNIKFRSFLGLFSPLDFNQIAPPFFTLATKVMTKILGFKEYVFRIIPFLVGCATVPAFYVLAKKVLDKNFSIIIAFALFALNTNLIKYSCEFKPYILDVFFAIICLIFFLNLNLAKISRKKTLFYGGLLAFAPWFSLPSVFVISAGIIILLFENFKKAAQSKPQALNNGGLVNPPYGKDSSKALIAPQFELTKKLLLIAPLALSLLIYLKLFILNNYSHSNYLVSFWDIAFLNKSVNSMLYVLLITFDYLFQPIRYTGIAAIFLIFSFVVVLIQKNKFAKITLLTLVLLLTASHFNIYPFASRLTLFMFPMLLLTMLKPLDFIIFNTEGPTEEIEASAEPKSVLAQQMKNETPQDTEATSPAIYFEVPTGICICRKIFSVILILFYLTFFWAFPQKVISSLFASDYDRKEYPREMTTLIMQKIKPNDIIYVNNSSDADFAYYSSFYKFKNKIIQEKIPESITKKEYFKKLNSLPKGRYWIFAPIDFTNIEVYPWLDEWASGKKILKEVKNDKKKHSLILYMEVK